LCIGMYVDNDVDSHSDVELNEAKDVDNDDTNIPQVDTRDDFTHVNKSTRGVSESDRSTVTWHGVEGVSAVKQRVPASLHVTEEDNPVPVDEMSDVEGLG